VNRGSRDQEGIQAERRTVNVTDKCWANRSPRRVFRDSARISCTISGIKYACSVFWALVSSTRFKKAWECIIISDPLYCHENFEMASTRSHPLSPTLSLRTARQYKSLIGGQYIASALDNTDCQWLFGVFSPQHSRTSLTFLRSQTPKTMKPTYKVTQRHFFPQNLRCWSDCYTSKRTRCVHQCRQPTEASRKLTSAFAVLYALRQVCHASSCAGFPVGASKVSVPSHL
jgi:hypothetical protein